MVQMAVIGVLGALLAIQFRSVKPEYGVYISIALSIFIFFQYFGEGRDHCVGNTGDQRENTHQKRVFDRVIENDRRCLCCGVFFLHL